MPAACPNEEPAVTVEPGRVATVRINRPEKRNALRARDAVELASVLAALDRDPDVRCVLLGGTGGWLCAGGDLSEGTAETPDDAALQIEQYQSAMRAVLAARAPVVVVLEGAAVGAGAAFALAADVCVAAPDSRITVPWITRGLVPDMGVAFFLARQVGAARAKACLLAGGAISAPQAVEWGLVAGVHDDVWVAAHEWADRLAAGPPVATTLTKRLLNHALFDGLDDYLALEQASMAEVFASSEPAEGFAAFLEKRAPNFDAGSVPERKAGSVPERKPSAPS
jgi:2-(1,2-epoxy-1,2-dihydrophenyl)acetyl-CoA isomerase